MTTFVPNPGRVDPYKNFRFRLTCEGKTVAGASKASGLPPSPQAVTEDAPTRLPPGRYKFEPITLERGVTYDPTFQNWANKTRDSQDPARTDLVLESFDESGHKLLAWTLRNCWVSELQALPDLDAGANAVSIQHLVLQHERLIIP